MDDLNFILFWSIVISSGWAIISTLRKPHENSRGWLPVNGGLLALALAARLLVPAGAGYVLGLAWLVFGLVPSRLFRRQNALVSAARYAEAEQVMRLIRWLHPLGDSAWELVWLRAMSLATAGELDAARSLLEDLSLPNPLVDQERRLTLFGISRDWAGMVGWIETAIPARELHGRPDVAARLIRAKGEIGDLGGMLGAYARHAEALKQLGVIELQTLGMICAFCGDIERCELVWRDRRLGLDQAATDLWIGTAHLAGGRRDEGEALLRPLPKGRDRLIGRSAALRLERPSAADVSGLGAIELEGLAAARLRVTQLLSL
ncbi:MAG TPA: hypothetical protein VGE07_17410 [Herpetosiphonaceae bacterium]